MIGVVSRLLGDTTGSRPQRPKSCFSALCALLPSLPEPPEGAGPRQICGHGLGLPDQFLLPSSLTWCRVTVLPPSRHRSQPAGPSVGSWASVSTRARTPENDTSGRQPYPCVPGPHRLWAVGAHVSLPRRCCP